MDFVLSHCFLFSLYITCLHVCHNNNREEAVVGLPPVTDVDRIGSLTVFSAEMHQKLPDKHR